MQLPCENILSFIHYCHCMKYELMLLSVTSYTMREIILLHFIGRVRVWSYEYK